MKPIHTAKPDERERSSADTRGASLRPPAYGIAAVDRSATGIVKSPTRSEVPPPSPPTPSTGESLDDAPAIEEREEHEHSPHALHEKLASAAGDELEATSASKTELVQRGDRLARSYTSRLEPGIAMSVGWQTSPGSALAQATIRIAPNDTVFTVQIPLTDRKVSSTTWALLKYANTVLAGSKAKEGVPAGDNDAWRLLVALSRSSLEVRKEFVEVADLKLLEILHKARLANLWKERSAADVLVPLLRECSPPVKKIMIKELLSTHFWVLDFSVDRFEARLAWELVRLLPPAEQEALLRDRPLGALGSKERDADHDLAGDIRDIQRRLSAEYRESSRFTTFEGSRREQGPYDTAGLDAAKEAIVARLLDESTWTGSLATLRSALKMAIRAGATPFIVDTVRTHFNERNKLLLIGLGFDLEGRFVEDIQDKTYETGWTRFVAGVKAFIDVLGSAWSLLTGPGGVEELSVESLKTVYEVVKGKYTGLRFDHSKDLSKDALEVLGTIVGGLDKARALISAIGIGPVELLDAIGQGIKVWDKIAAYARSKDVVARLTDGDPSNDGVVKPNKIIVASDQELGATIVRASWLPIAGQAAVFDELTVKMGAGFIAEAFAELKAPTSHDGRQFISMRIKALRLTDIQVAWPNKLINIDGITVEGLHFELVGEPRKPADLITRIADDVARVLMQVMQFLPSFVGIGAALQEALHDGLAMSRAASDITKVGAIQQLGFGFTKIALDGLDSTMGLGLERLEVGATEVSLVGAHTFDLATLERSKLEERLSEQREELADKQRDAATLRSKGKQGSRRGQILDDQITWLRRAVENTRYQLEVLDQLAPRVRELEQLKKQQEQRKEDVRDRTKDAIENAGGRRWERNQAADDAVERDAELETIAARIQKLSLEISLLQGANATGKLGAIELRGLTTSSVALGSLTTSAAPITGTLGLGSAGAKVELPSVVGKSLELRDGARRDLWLAARLQSAGKLAFDIVLAAQQQKRPLTPNEQQIVEKLQKQGKADMAELAALRPLLEEYAALRERLIDPRNPLSGEERGRFAQITKLLAVPPSTRVESFDLRGVTVRANLLRPTGDKKSGTQDARIGLDVASATVTGITRRGEPGQGNTSVARVDVRGGRVDFDALRRGQSLAVGAERIDVSGVQTEGKRVGLESRRMEIDRELLFLAHAMTDLAISRQPGAALELARLQRRWAILDKQRSEVVAKLAEPHAIDAFITSVEQIKPKLVDHEGHDRSRGFSIRVGKDLQLTLANTRSELALGKTHAPGEVSLARASELVSTYTAGIARIDRQLAALVKPKLGANPTLAAKSAAAFEKLDRGELGKLRATAKAELERWRVHELTLTRTIAKLDARLEGLTTLLAWYGTVVQSGAAIPLDLELAKVESLELLSAEQMVFLAQAQKNGFEGWKVGKLAITGVDLDITNLGALLDAKPNLASYRDIVRIRGTDGTFVDSVQIDDVERGGVSVIKHAELRDLGGEVQLIGPDRYHVQDVRIGRISLERLQWDSASTSIEATKVDLDDIHVDADIDTRADALAGTITSFRLGKLAAHTLRLRSGDKLIRLGSLEAGDPAAARGKPELAAISVTNLDLSSNAIGSVQLRQLQLTQLSTDLGAGMSVQAENLEAASIRVGAVVTAARQRDAAASPEAPIKPVTANRFTVDVEGLEGDALAIKLQESGVEARIEQLRGGKLRGVAIDLHSGELVLDRFELASLVLGPIRYAEGDTQLDIYGGVTLDAVELSAAGRLLLNPAEDAKLRAKQPDRVPQLIQDLRASEIRCKHAALHNLHYRSKDVKGDTTKVAIGHASADDLVVHGYDFVTGAMQLDLGPLEVDELDAKLQSKLSNTKVGGGLSIRGLSFASLRDAQGRPVTRIGVRDAASKGLTIGSQTRPKPGAKPSETLDVDARFAGLSAELEQRGDAWDAEGGTTTFRDITLDNLTLSKLHWQADDTDVTDIEARDALISGVKVSGHVLTRMRERAGLPLPQSDLFLDKLHVDKIDARQITITHEGDDVGSRRKTTTTIDRTRRKGALLEKLDVTGIESVGGKLQKGRIDLGTLDVGAQLDSAIVKGPLGSAFKAAVGLQAHGLWVEFSAGSKGELVKAGANDIQLRNSTLTIIPDAFGTKVTIEVPSLDVTGVDFAYFSQTAPDALANFLDLKFDSVKLLQDGKFKYEWGASPTIEKLDDEKSLAERKREVAELAPGTPLHGELSDKRAVLHGIDFKSLFDTVNGTIHADLFAETIKNVQAKVDLTVTSGVIHPKVVVTTMGTKARVALYFVSPLASVGSLGIETLIEQIAKRLNIRLIDHTHSIIDAVAPNPTIEAGERSKALAKAVEKSGPFYRGGKLMEYEKEAHDRYTKRVSEILATERFIAAHDGKPGWAAAVAQARLRLDDLRNPKTATDDFLDVYLSNLDAALTLGPWSTVIPGPPSVKDAPRSRLKVGKSKLQFKPGTGRTHELGLDVDRVSVETAASDGSNLEASAVSIDGFSFLATLASLFPGGSYRVYGWKHGAHGKINNPIEGALKAGTKLQGVKISKAELYKRPAKP